MSMDSSRRLNVTGAYNVRDLGGYATNKGTTTTWRAFLRADGLHNVTHEGLTTLLDYGVRTVIDLRSPREVAEAANPLQNHPNITYWHIAIFDDAALYGNDVIMPDSLTTMYRSFLDTAQIAFLKVFAAMADAEEGAVLFHCTAGKDRTGIVAALLLLLAEVDQQTVVADYSESAGNLAPLFAAIYQRIAAASLPTDAERYQHLLGSDAQTMEATLAYLHDQYGSAEDYLKHIGLDKDVMTRIKRRLLAPKNA